MPKFNTFSFKKSHERIYNFLNPAKKFYFCSSLYKLWVIFRCAFYGFLLYFFKIFQAIRFFDNFFHHNFHKADIFNQFLPAFDRILAFFCPRSPRLPLKKYCKLNYR